MKKYKFKINDDKYEAGILEYKSDMVLVEVNGVEYKVDIELEKKEKRKLVRSQMLSSEKPITQTSRKVMPQASAGSLTAPIPGLVLKILVNKGDIVKAGQTVIILEAMKMESEINSETNGEIKNIFVKEGENIQEGQAIMEIGE